MKLEYHGLTHPGKRRSHNEDAFYTEPPLFLVADGLGGHKAGEIASKEAISRLTSFYFECIEQAARYNVRTATSCLKKGILRANEALHQLSQEKEELKGLGTTLSGVLLLPAFSQAVVFHIGDSRVYHWDGNKLTQLTKDHTYVQYLLESGQISQEESGKHPLRNALLQAVGTTARLRIETHALKLSPHGSFLLTTDGVHSLVKDRELSEVMKQLEKPQAICEAILELALQRGGLDNITVVAVNYALVP